MPKYPVSVVVAAYNEGSGLFEIVDRILADLTRASERLDFELLVVDDGSSDATAAMLARFSAERPGAIRVLTHPVNHGLVAAMRTGCEAATKATVAYLDADLSYRPEIVERLVAAKAESGAAVAIASPYMPGGTVSRVPLDRLIASRVGNWILSRCSGGRLSTFTGMVRAYDTAVLRELFTRKPVGEFNSWVIAALIQDERRIVEIPADLAWPPERYAASPRMSLESLVRRCGQVVATADFLWAACRRSKTLKTGTLVLSAQPTRPYIS